MHSAEYFRINDFFQWEYELWIFLHLLNKIIDGRFHFFFVCSLPVSLSLSVSLFSLTGFTLRMSQKLYGSCVVALLVTLSLEVIYRNFFKKYAYSGKLFNIKIYFQCDQRKIIDWFPNDENLTNYHKLPWKP